MDQIQSEQNYVEQTKYMMAANLAEKQKELDYYREAKRLRDENPTTTEPTATTATSTTTTTTTTATTTATKSSNTRSTT